MFLSALDRAELATAIPRWLRMLLIISAIIELASGLRDLPILLGDTSQIPGPGLGGTIIKTKIALHPLVAAVALFCAVTGRLGGAVIAMAVLALLTWANYLPSIALHGTDAGDGTKGILTAFQIILVPLFAATVIALAVQRKHLTLATCLAILPTWVGVLGVLAFAIGVSIWGF